MNGRIREAESGISSLVRGHLKAASDIVELQGRLKTLSSDIDDLKKWAASLPKQNTTNERTNNH